MLSESMRPTVCRNQKKGRSHGLGKHPDMEKALMTWFVQQRNQNIPISIEMIQHKAKYFYNQITGKNDFGASLGWISNFKARHGIRKLKICGEKVSSDVSAVEPFRQKLKSIIEEMDLDHDQIYNADESAAFWEVIPANTLAHSQEKSASGRKISKDRVTLCLVAMHLAHISYSFW
ncbi:jerky protein homolog-like [Bactrocera tryoni]|uniref:jerky protein homolog-like n=1 Tax=Bactrocera tryoni TaxID=59916 RepID=UPI001A95D20A|nr:jerky protein homolog-like [Bactrocera tryoni]